MTGTLFPNSLPFAGGKGSNFRERYGQCLYPPGDYKAKIQVMMRPLDAISTEAPKEVCVNMDVTVPRKLLARTMENTCSRKFCRQSPIDIKPSQYIFELPSSSKNGALMDVHYADENLVLTKTPGKKASFQVKTDKSPTLEYNGKTYALANIHAHIPSEHTVNGVHYPGEVHLVHKAVVARPDGEHDYLVQGFS